MNDYLETECVEKIKKECLLQVFDEIDSTNEYLKKLVKREAISLPLPVLVVAERQTAGKRTNICGTRQIRGRNGKMKN